LICKVLIPVLRKLLFFLVVLFGGQQAHAQFFQNNFYYEGEVGGITSFFVTNAAGEAKVISMSGISFRGGLGLRDESGTMFLGIHSGMDGSFRHQTGILPLYLNSKIAIPVTDKGKIVVSFGYGKSFQIGSENLKGYLRKYTLGLAQETQKENLYTFFVEVNNHGFSYPDDDIPAITLNLGCTFTFL